MRIAVLPLVLLFAVAAQAADSISIALPCGRVGVAGGLPSGADLGKVTIDTAKFPNAICNDGTPAVFYYGPATTNADRNKWIIFLQGGGACNSGLACAERWCSINSNYGIDKMSTSVAKPAIRGDGFLSPDAGNYFGTWNRVLVYYCSSDQWQGTKSNTLSAPIPGTEGQNAVPYAIEFRGSFIVDAVLDTLRNDTPSVKRRVSRHEIESDGSPWPDLDDADAVLFAGSSAGGNGVRNNVDRVAAKLKTTNPGLDFRAVIDAVFTPDTSERDYSQSRNCLQNPVNCTYEGYTRTAWQTLDVALIAGRGDASCVTYHIAQEPGSEWICNDKNHIMLNHIATPFFVRQDLQDPDVGGNYVEDKFGTASDFAISIESTFRNFPAGEEPRSTEPGIFAPQCADHESFSHGVEVFNVRIGGINWHDTLRNWWTGAQPKQVIKAYTGTPGAAPGCP